MRQAYSVLVGFIVALLLYLLMAVTFGIINYANIMNIGRLGYDITHYLIVAVAAFFAAKKAADKGWLVGLILAFVLAALSLVIHWSFGEPLSAQLLRSVLTLVVGSIAGMFGVNI